MPLLMCPNCNASMTEVKRNDVAFDMCPTCRGVWLDRGELEKIIAGVQADRGGHDQGEAQFWQGQRQSQQQHPQRPQHSYGERGEYGERGQGGHDERTGGKRRRVGGFDLLDIFGD
ncbi:MAG: zf-TFIIB domain-containing protein [Hyphomonadaceae bacterium]